MNHSRLLIAFCALLQSVTLIAGSPWGIMSHPLWSNKPADLEMEIKRCKEAGITCMRTDFGFGAIAGEKGKYNFTRYDNLVVRVPSLYFGPATHHNAAMPRMVCLTHTAHPEDIPTGREVRGLDVSHQAVYVYIVVVYIGYTGINHFTQVVGRHVCGHPHSYS